MSKIIDVTGKRFDRLVVIGRSDRTSKSGALWLCGCDCGGEAVTTSLKLRNGLAKSCGCRKLDGMANFRHGYANKGRTYRTWKEMRQRCLNPNSDKWKWYGGRGISICAEWDDFDRFLSDMGDRPDKMTLDRIDSDGNYCKENCRWATAKQQAETNRGVFKKNAEPINKTSEKDLLAMREMRASGMMLKDVAAHFGKSSSVVSGLINHGPRKKISGVAAK